MFAMVKGKCKLKLLYYFLRVDQDFLCYLKSKHIPYCRTLLKGPVVPKRFLIKIFTGFGVA